MLTSCDVDGVVRIEYVARWKVSIAVKDMNDAKSSFLRFKICVFAGLIGIYMIMLMIVLQYLG